MKHFSDYILEKDNEFAASIKETFMNEGVDVTFDRQVSITDEHEKKVDTSISNNPSLVNSIIDNVDIYSVFKRKSGEAGDGNPLLYALKKENHYVLTNPDKAKEKIEAIVKKYFSEHGKKDITIMVPSTNKLNSYFAKVVSSYCNNPSYIDNLVAKMTIEEVDDYIYEDSSKFREFYGKRFEDKYKLFKKYCNSIKDKYYFKFHCIKDMEMRKVIEHTIKLEDKYWKKYIDAINDKDVIIVDDSITLGNTIIETCKILTDNFTPKSVTVLTLLSPLYDENGERLKDL